MKKLILLFATLLAFGQNAFAYSNLTAVAPSGQTLYYKWNDTWTGFVVTYPGSSEVSPYSINGGNFTKPSGDLVIPTKVTYLGRTYSVEGVDMFAFKGCTGLTSVTFDSSGYISISACAFENCTGLSSINIPASVHYINSQAFQGCSGLTSITVTSGNTYFDSRNNCNAIIGTSTNILVIGCKNTVIPNSVTGIDSYSFRGCTGLTSINIPSSVTWIGNYSFAGCTGLTSMTINSTVPPSVSRSTFDYVPRNILMYVPTASINSYHTANVWSEFPYYIGIGQHAIIATSANPITGTVTGGGGYAAGETATLTAIPNAGYHFAQWQDGNTQNPRTITVTGNATYTATFASNATVTATISQITATSAYVNIAKSSYAQYYYYFCGPLSEINGRTDEEIIDDVNLHAWSTDRNFYNVSKYMNDLTPNTAYLLVVVPYNIYDVAGTVCRTQFTTLSSADTATMTATISEITATSAHAEIVKGQHTSYYYYFYGPQSTFTQNGLTTDEAIISYVNQHYGQSDRVTDNTSRYMNGLTPNTAYLLVVVPYNSNGDVGTITKKQFTTLNNNGIEDASGETYAVSCQDGRLTVGGAGGELVSVYSIDGRCVYSSRATETTVIDMPTAGVYLVKVGNTPARKVVIIR